MLDTILFDLDGTLLPMDMRQFMKLYFAALSEVCAPYGFEHKPLVAAVWHGTEQMVKNDGARPNDAVFWEAFAQALGRDDVSELKPELDLFYERGFNKARAATTPNPGAAGMVRALKKKGYTLVLATNPLFPLVGVRTRLSWVGLAPEDFDHVTSYENCHFSKPNPKYYEEILRAVGRPAENCVMVGNDATEDGNAAATGLPVWLVTDGLTNDQQVDLAAFKCLSFADCIGEMAALPALA